MGNVSALLFHCKSHTNASISHWITTNHHKGLLDSLKYLYRILLIETVDNQKIVIGGAFIKTSCHHTHPEFLDNALYGISVATELRPLLQLDKLSIIPSLIKEPHDLTEDEMLRLISLEILGTQPAPRSSKDIVPLTSFSMSVTLKNGKFLALNLKFILQDGSHMLTAWSWESSNNLFKCILEYFQYLQRLQIPFDADLLTETMQKSPQITSDETELGVAGRMVRAFREALTIENDLIFSMIIPNRLEAAEFCINPNHAEWLTGYIGNTLKELTNNGEITLPEGRPN